MFIWIPLVIIFICLLVIIFIIIKKFPALAILDVDKIPGKQEEKVKKEIIRQRLERDLSSVGGFLGKFWLKLNQFFSNFLSNSYQYLKRAKEEHRQRKKLNINDRQQQIERIFPLAYQAIKDEDWEQAEEYLIKIISLDPKNLTAFWELGESYYQAKKFIEARTTWEHALKLCRQLKDSPDKLAGLTSQEIKFSLAETCQQIEDLPAAIEYANQALDLEPNNPRYLDLIFDLSIIKKDKKVATEYFERLSIADPENKRLEELKNILADLSKEDK